MQRSVRAYRGAGPSADLWTPVCSARSHRSAAAPQAQDALAFAGSPKLRYLLGVLIIIILLIIIRLLLLLLLLLLYDYYYYYYYYYYYTGIQGNPTSWGPC